MEVDFAIETSAFLMNPTPNICAFLQKMNSWCSVIIPSSCDNCIFFYFVRIIQYLDGRKHIRYPVGFIVKIFCRQM